MIPAAFFDIDGTLLPPPSLERRFLRYLAWRVELRVSAWSPWLSTFVGRVWRDPLDATCGNKAHYAGIRTSALGVFLSLFHRHPLAFLPAALARIDWHAGQGHRIFLVSGTLRPLAEAVAAILASRLQLYATSVGVVATRLESGNGRFTGRTIGNPVCGPAKAQILTELAREHGLDLSASYAYGNSHADRWMLGAVGHPAAVNPSWCLRLPAQRRGWPVLQWRPSVQRVVAPGEPLRASNAVGKCL